MTSASTIILLSQTQAGAAAKVMARAFMEDPFFVYTLPEKEKRKRVLPWLYERVIRYGIRYGKVCSTEAFEGAAVWLGPEKPRLSNWGAIVSGMFLLPLQLTPKELRLNLRLSNYAGKLHKQAITGRHWYLLGLGVDPEAQGRGIGKALMKPVLELAGREGIPCYLDTNNEKNIAFYKQSGFEPAGKGRADPAGPETWGMIRK